MAKIKAATVSVTLEAESAKFTQALQRAQNQAHNSTNSIIRSLAAAQAASANWANATTKAFFAPFKAFQKAIAPFKTMVNQVIAIASNLTHPFRQLVAYVSGPFVRGFKTAFDAAKRVLTGFGVAATAAGAALGFIMHDVAEQTIEMAKWSYMMGISIQTFNRVSYAARVMGMTIEQVGDAMSSLTEKIYDTAQGGGGITDMFNQLTKGNKKAVQKLAEEWASWDPAKQFVEFQKVLDNMEPGQALFFAKEISDGMAEVYVMAQLTGKKMSDLNKEAERFGSNSISADGFLKLKAALGGIKAEAFNIFNAVGDRLAEPAAKALVYLQGEFNKWVQSYDTKKGDLKTGFDLMVKDVTKKTLLAIGYALKGLSDFVKTINQVFNAIGQLLEKYTDFKMPSSGKGITEANKALMTSDDRKRQYDLQRQVGLMNDVLYGQKKLTDEQLKMLAKQGVKTTVTNPYTGDVTALPDKEIAAAGKAIAQSTYEAFENEINQKYSAEGILDKASAALIDRANKPIELGKPTPSKTNKMVGKTSVDRDAATTAEAALKAQKEVSKSILQSRKDLNDVKISLGIGPKTSGWAAEVAAAQVQLNDKYVEMTENANKLTDKAAKQAELKKIEVDREKTRLALAAAMDQKLKDSILRLQTGMDNVAEKIRLQFDMQGKGSASGLTKEQRQFNQETISGQQSIKDDYDALLKEAEYAYTKDSEQYKNLLAEKEQMLKEYTDFRIAEEERANATSNATGPLADFYNGLNQKEGALADHQSVIEGYSNEEIQTAMKTEKGKRDIMLQTGGQLLGEAAKTNKKAFEMQKALNIANAIMNTAQGVTRAIAEGGPYAGPALAAMIGALGMIQIQQIRSQQFVGQFHSGIDELPSTGTYLGEKGERVVGKRLNQDLKDFMAESKSSSNETAYSPTWNVQTVVTADQLEELMKKDKRRFQRAIM